MLLLAVALAAVTAVPAQGHRSAATAECPQTTAHIAVERGKGPPMKKLNELPPANAYKAVYRHIGGCEVPVVVRYNVGRR
jgi:hypothetical protein